MELRVLSWNIWKDGDLNGVAEYVKNSRADIVGLQEVIPEREPNIINLIERLDYQSVFSPALKSDGRDMGNAIFSKYPIRATRTHILSDTMPPALTAEQERRVAVQADIEVGDLLLSVFTTHLAHTHQKPSAIQDSQVDALIKILPKQKTVVIGDFNATPDSKTIQKMRSVLFDTDSASPPTWSMYPKGCAECNPQAVEIRLDYIFTSRDLKVRSPEVGYSKASDHLPVSVTISF